MMLSPQSGNLFAFVHIPKTAGTSFNKVLNHVYGNNLLNAHLIENNLSDYVKSLTNTQKEELTSFISHGHYNEASLLFPDRKIVLATLVREPVARIISYINFIKQHKGHRYYHKIQNMTNEEILDYLISQNELEIVNDQCRYLCNSPLAEKAIESIHENFSFVGLTEKFNSFVQVCTQLLLWDISQIDLSKKHNQTTKNTNNTSLEKNNTSLEKKVTELNQEDIKLYKYIHTQSQDKGVLLCP